MRVAFSRAAQTDIASIHDYISHHSPRAAARVVGAIERSTDRLALFPHSGRPGAVEGTREVIVRGLPYIVVYRVLRELVEVTAVFHAKQNIPRGG